MLCGADARLNGSQFLVSLFPGHPDEQQTLHVLIANPLKLMLDCSQGWESCQGLIPILCSPFWYVDCSLCHISKRHQICGISQPCGRDGQQYWSQTEFGALDPEPVGLGSFHLKASGTFKALP